MCQDSSMTAGQPRACWLVAQVSFRPTIPRSVEYSVVARRCAIGCGLFALNPPSNPSMPDSAYGEQEEQLGS